MTAGLYKKRFKIFYKNVYLLYIILPFIILGCATTNDIRQLQQSIGQLQKTQDVLQVNQADLSSQMTDLVGTMEVLNEQLVDSSERMSLLSQRLDDIDANLSNRMDDLSRQLSGMPQSVELKPSEIYRIAFNDYNRGKYDLATIGFRNYLDRYPKGELAGKALFYLAECYFVKKEWTEAFGHYNRLLKKYRKHEFVPEAMLKKAICLVKMKQRKEAIHAYQSVIDSFPNSMPAAKAREYLKTFKTPVPPEDKGSP